jgi:hypothetical protein
VTLLPEMLIGLSPLIVVEPKASVRPEVFVMETE